MQRLSLIFRYLLDLGLDRGGLEQRFFAAQASPQDQEQGRILKVYTAAIESLDRLFPGAIDVRVL